jgi:HAD superfamily hydrolase (TIGR01484 family)
MAVKLVALDIDGTLLKGNLRIHPENVKVIKRLHEHNIKVLLATGRSLYYGLKIAYKLQMHYHTQTIVLYNGGLILKITDNLERVVLQENFISQELSDFLFQFAQKYQIGFVGYAIDDFEKAYYNNIYNFRLKLKLLILKKFNKLQLVKVTDFLPTPCIKVILFCFNESQIKMMMDSLCLDQRFEVSKTRYRNIFEVNAKGVNKANAVK